MSEAVDMGNGAQILSALISALALVLAASSFFRQRNDKTIDEIKAAQKQMEASLKADMKALREDDARQFERIDKIEADLAGVKAEVKHLPTVEDVHNIALEQARQGEMLRALTDVCGGLAGSVKAIERALLEREARGADR